LQTPDAIVTHVGGGISGVGSPFAEYHGARNRFWTFIKCMPGALFWPLLPVHLVLTILALSANVFRGRGLAAWRGFIAGLADWRAVWRSRRQIQDTRKVNARDIARALAWSPFGWLERRPVIRPIRDNPAPPPSAPIRPAF
jgi:hypothetical protein